MKVGEWSEMENELRSVRRKIDLRGNSLAQIRTITPEGIDYKWFNEANGTGMSEND